MTSTNAVWQVRPAGAANEGKQVVRSVLQRAIEDDLVGELDEVRGPGETHWQVVGEHRVTSEWLPRPPARRMAADEEAETDMTPMIDVTFQLVIFFMITATFTIQKTLDLPSTKPDPQAASRTLEQLQEERIVVVLTASGSVTVDGEAVELSALADALREANRERQTAELILDVDDDAVHDTVVKVIDAAGAANLEKVLFVSRSES